MENKQIEALEKLVAVKDETIKELERQILLLKTQPQIAIPQFPQTPLNPWTLPHTPQQYPWSQPYAGQQLMGTTLDPNATYTLTNFSDGSTNVIDLKTCSRV